MAAFVNPVPLGQAGTGEAFILPESNSLGEFVNNLAVRQHQAQVQADQDKALKIKQQQGLNKVYDDNAFKVTPGQLYGSELNGLIQQHINQAAKFRQQGVDIYHPDPLSEDQVKASEGYLKDRATLEQLMNYRKSADEDFTKISGVITDPEKAAKYDPDSIKQVQDYYTQNPDGNRLQNSFFGKETPPQLQLAYNAGDFSKKYVTPKTTKVTTSDGFNKKEVEAPDLPGIRAQVDAGFQTDPTAQKMLAANGVDVPYLKGMKDRNGVMKDIDAYYQTPAGKDALDSRGVQYGSDEYWSSLPKLADNRIESSANKYEKIANDLTAVNAAKLGQNKDNEKLYTGLNYALALHNSKNSDVRLAIEQARYDDVKNKDKNILGEPDYATVKMTEPNGAILPDGKTKAINIGTYTTAWQPVKGEAIPIDIANFKNIELNGHVSESRTGNISRVRVMQVGNLPKLPTGSYANDATLAHLSDMMKVYVQKNPSATRMPIPQGGSLPIPTDRSQINPSYLSDALPKESVAMVYKDNDIKSGKLADGAKPILIPAKQIMEKLRLNKLKTPKDDFLGLDQNSDNSSGNDDFGLFNK